MDAFFAKGLIECLLLVSDEPLTLPRIASVAGISEREAKWFVEELQNEYNSANRGISIREIANGYKVLSRPEYAPYIARLDKENQRSGLSYAALETLAIIAYKQPVTRGEIDSIRGVRSDRTVYTLLEKQLIKEVGRLEAIGKPILYGTTDFFLDCFGLKDLSQLPEVLAQPAAATDDNSE
ncbi:MAG: SMC-Scp complex subunit ScpB [bacterium]|jgi:segregation and condensation protein B